MQHMSLGKAETRQQLADWWDSFDTRYMRPVFSRPDADSPQAAAAGMLQPQPLAPGPGRSFSSSDKQNLTSNSHKLRLASGVLVEVPRDGQHLSSSIRQAV